MPGVPSARTPTATCRATRWWRCCTGSQGEPRAALARIAEDDHPTSRSSRGDRVIFSSRTIPGNEKAIGARRSTASSTRASRSSPTARSWCTSPAIRGGPRSRTCTAGCGRRSSIPVHGEALHMAEHAALARRARRAAGDAVPRTATWCGSRPGRRRSSTRCRRPALQGRLAAGRRRGAHRGGSAPARLCRRGVGRARAERTRRAHRRSGDPAHRHSGSRRRREPARGDRLRRGARGLRAHAAKRRRDPDAVAEAVRRAVRAALAAHWSKKPICHVHVLEV